MAILMVLSFSASIFAVQNANAADVKSYPFVDALPKPAGVGQTVLINWGLLNYLNNVNDGWNVTLQITDPNGKATNYTGKTWSTGTVGRKMSFMEPGNYTLQCIFDGDYYRNNDYLPSESEIVTLEIIEGYWKPDYPGHSLPTEYWTRPVDSQLREWYTIMGSWVAKPRNLFAPYNDAPESAHILWSMPIGDNAAGLSGGDNGMVAAQNGDAYEGKFVDSVILNGVLYYNREFSTSGGYSTPVSSQMVVAVDLRTGKTLWERNYDLGNGRISRGQILTFINENNRGTFSYLWIGSSGTMYAINPVTGNLVYNMTDVPSGDFYIGPNGEMLKYSVVNAGTNTNPNYVLRQWNSTAVVMNNPSLSSTSDAWGSNVQTANTTANPRSGASQYNATRYGYDLNITLPTGVTTADRVIFAIPCDRVILATTASATDGIYLTGISLDEENKGYPLFTRRQFSAPDDWKDLTITSIGQAGWAAFSADDYVGIYWTKENRVNYAFSLETGKNIWQSEPQIYADAWSDTVTSYGPEKVFAYGKLYEASVGGIVYCYDAITGELLWTYEAKDKFNESYHTENWWIIPVAISDGKIYFGHLVHSAQQPLARGAPFFALDCETHELVWEIDGAFRQTRWGGRAVMGDSVIATMDLYDQQIYAIGKGPSETTVTSSNPATIAGNTILISGTVMDISPGTASDNAQFRFPKGVPAVSDESQSEWMLHVYKKFKMPEEVTGVEVQVFAVQGDQNIDIGTATSTSSGTFAIAWTPPADATGVWDVYAYFGGSASYFGSWSQTAMTISAAPTPDEPAPETTPTYVWYLVVIGIIAIIAVIANIFVSLRKK